MPTYLSIDGHDNRVFIANKINLKLLGFIKTNKIIIK